MPEEISRFDTSKHVSLSLYATNPTEYFKKAREHFTQEDLNIPQNYQYINHALNYHPQQLMIYAQQIGRKNKQEGAYYLFKTLKMRKLILSPENKGRDPSKPLISRCPVGNKVEEIIRYMKENQES